MKTFFILPRQSGKTTFAIYEFLKDPENTLFVSHDSKTSVRNYKKFMEISNKPNENFMTCFSFEKELKFRKHKRIIFDEYFFCENKKEMYEEVIKNEKISEIFLFGSPKETYNQFLFDQVKTFKEVNASISQIFLWVDNLFEDQQNENLKKQISELYYNFLTDADCKVLKYPVLEDNVEILSMLGEKSYNLEYRLNFLNF